MPGYAMTRILVYFLLCPCLSIPFSTATAAMGMSSRNLRQVFQQFPIPVENKCLILILYWPSITQPSPVLLTAVENKCYGLIFYRSGIRRVVAV